MALKDWTKQKNVSISNKNLREAYTRESLEIYNKGKLIIDLGSYITFDRKKIYHVGINERGFGGRGSKFFKTKSEAQKYMKEFMRKN